MKFNKWTLCLAAVAALAFTGCSTAPSNGNVIVQTITDPSNLRLAAEVATEQYVTQNPAAKTDIALVDTVLGQLISTGTVDPAAVKDALVAANVQGDKALYAVLVDAITTKFSQYAGQGTVKGALNQNAQLTAALEAILAGTASGLKATQ